MCGSGDLVGAAGSAQLGHLAAGALAATTLAVASVPTMAALAPAWKVGDCFTRADVPADEVILRSGIDCAKAHLVQVIGREPLRGLDAYSYAELRDQDNDVVRAKLSAGQRSLLCVIWTAREVTGSDTPFMGVLRGDARRLDSRRTLAGLRNCSDIDAVSEELVSVSCGRLHAEEIVAYFLVQLPVAAAAMTEAQRAPLDASCRDIATALVGAKREDLHAFVDAPAGTVDGVGHRSLPA